MKLLNRILSQPIIQPRRILLYGMAGIGTSTFAAGLPAPIFLPTDDSTLQIKCRRFPVAQRFEQIMQALEDLYSEMHEYRTIVIDPLHSLEHLLHAELCNKYGTQTVFDIPNGQDLVLAYWHCLLRRLDLLRRDLGLHILLVGHAELRKRSELAAKPVGAVHHYALRLHESATKLLQSWCDEIFFATLSDSPASDRVILTSPSHAHLAKCRLPLPAQLPMQPAAVVAYLQSESPVSSRTELVL